MSADRYLNRHWGRLADPSVTPSAASLAGLSPWTCAAYYELCRRPDLPSVLVDRMVEHAARETLYVTLEAFCAHLSCRLDLTPEHLSTLLCALAPRRDDPFQASTATRVRVIDRLLRHPHANAGVILRAAWDCDPGSDNEKPDLLHERLVLLDVALVRDGLALAAAARARGVSERVVRRETFAVLVRRLRLGGPMAVVAAARLIGTWRASSNDLVVAAHTVSSAGAVL